MQSTMALGNSQSPRFQNWPLARRCLASCIRRNTIAKRPDFANVAGPFAGNPLSTQKRTFFLIRATPFTVLGGYLPAGSSLEPLSLPLTGSPGPSHTLPSQRLIFPNPLLPRGSHPSVDHSGCVSQGQASGPHPCRLTHARSSHRLSQRARMANQSTTPPGGRIGHVR